jgi:hypothetical protein
LSVIVKLLSAKVFPIFVQMFLCRLCDGKKIKTPKCGKKKNEFLLGMGRHTLMQTLVIALACGGLPIGMTAAWASC